MKRDGKALSLTDEVFRRQTQMPDGVQVVDETAEILHPFEIAE